MNDEFKTLLESKTFWGAVVAIGSSVAAMVLGHGLPDADQALLVQYILTGVSVIGGVFAIYGRYVATKKIG